MKRFFFILLMVVMLVGNLIAIQPARKPFLQIKIDGKAYKNGDNLTVTSGQKLMIGVELEGGRKDFCKFPDTYADIAGTAQILSRGSNGLTYEADGVKSEWKLLNETVLFSTDEFVKVNSQPNQMTAEINISNTKFSQSFVKISVKAKWQFTRAEKITTEDNIAESTIYFKVAGTSDVWFSSKNIQVNGMKNDQILEKLTVVQSEFDSIENFLIKMKFSAVQHSVRTLQTAVNEVKTTIDSIKLTAPSYQSRIVFIGLPTDNPYQVLGTLSEIKTNWTTAETLLPVLKTQLGQLSAEPSKESKDALIGIIAKYADWQYKLPENTFTILSRYMPDLNVEAIKIPGNIHFIAEEKTITNYSQTLNDLKPFLDQRIEQIPLEIQKIGSTQSRLQAVRLFDGMLRSYFSSVNWAEWKNTRE
jgi:hypothetical protein